MNDESSPLWDQIAALPTWILINLIYPLLPKYHIYKRFEKVPPLYKWSKWRTPLTTLFDTIIWILGGILFVTLIAVYMRYLAQ